jgi:hypothetical protein
VDWQRDDCLGRIQLHPQSLFQHRRQLLRTIRRDANAYASCNCHTDGDCNCHADSYAKRNTHGYSNADHDTSSDTNPQN